MTEIHVNVRAFIERRSSSSSELLVQERNKPYEGRPTIELPGGRVEPFESLADALRREVLEETGLVLSAVDGLAGRIETRSADSNVECLAPFAVYQTLQGPVDSFGVYFRCRAEGEPVSAGDETRSVRYLPLAVLAGWLHDQPETFSFVDRAGLIFYLRECGYG